MTEYLDLRQRIEARAAFSIRSPDMFAKLFNVTQQAVYVTVRKTIDHDPNRRHVVGWRAALRQLRDIVVWEFRRARDGQHGEPTTSTLTLTIPAANLEVNHL